MGTMMLLALALSSGHVRTAEPALDDAVRRGVERSQTMRALIATIEASDIIVHIARGTCPSRAAACMMLGRPTPGVAARLVRINVVMNDATGAPTIWDWRRLAMVLAHELQHVAEIAAAPEVIDTATLQRFYASAGRDHDGTGQAYETVAAVRAGQSAWRETGERRR